MPSSTSITKAHSVGSRVGGPLLSESPEVLQDLRRQFREQRYISLPAFFDSELFATTASRLAESEFEVQVSGVGTEWHMKPNALVATLNWLVNAAELLRAIRYVTDCDDVGFFSGRIYRMDPSSGQSFEWHDDREHVGERRLAISVNLGDRPYAGGVFQIREKGAPESVAEVPNVGRGDAVLFRIAPDLEHRVTPVEGTVPKLALAGWFAPGPSYYRSLLERGRPRTGR
jgi:hypothetical protein